MANAYIDLGSSIDHLPHFKLRCSPDLATSRSVNIAFKAYTPRRGNVWDDRPARVKGTRSIIERRTICRRDDDIFLDGHATAEHRCLVALLAPASCHVVMSMCRVHRPAELPPRRSVSL